MKPETVPTIEARTLLHRWSEPRVTGHGFVWVCTDCERFAGPMPPPRDQLCDVRLLAEVDRLTAERAEARDNAEAAEELAREADTERKTVEAELAALRIEHEAQRAVIDGLRATGVMLTRERNEARRERDELRAELDNERGVGMPPRPGWARNDFDKRRIGIAWYRPANADGSLPPADATDYAFAMWVYREAPETGWTWECECEGDNAKDIRGKAPTARRAMCMADAALAGGKS